MKFCILFLAVAGLATVSSAAHADVIGFTMDGQLTSPDCSVVWAPGQSSAPSTLTISDGATGTSADVAGNILLDQPGDPTVDVENIVYNHSDSTWPAYIATIQMNQSFSIEDPYINQPGDWTFGVTQPAYNASLGEYVGYLELNAGTPIPSLPDRETANELDFGYSMSFDGTQAPTFGQTLTAVPEPSSLALIACLAAASLAGCRIFAAGRMKAV